VEGSLGDRLARRDEGRFIGRDAEIAFFDRLLAGQETDSVVFVHGPGGIGKSALLREVIRRAASDGWATWYLDGRELAPDPEELERTFAEASEEERPIIVVDTYEHAASLDGHLREQLVPGLPSRAIVVLAGRQPPSPGWSVAGWEHITRSLRLDPLSTQEGVRLIEKVSGVDASSRKALVEWSGGSPLALTLATEVALGEPDWDESGLESHSELINRLVDRLLGPQARVDRSDIIATAALARVTTATLLTAVLPGQDPHEAYDWLRAQSITEPIGGGLAMHDLVRRSVQANLSATRPERERELRRRIADHFFDRALAGEPRHMVDLAELIQNPALRWGIGAEGAADLFADVLRPGELDDLSVEVLARGSDTWWEQTRRLADASPGHFIVARDAVQTLRGIAIAFTPANASPAALADPLVGSWIEHARQTVPDGNAILWRDSLDLTASDQGDLSSRVLAVLNTAAILRTGLANPRFLYLPINPMNEPSVAFARDSGSRHVPELDVKVGDVTHQCHVIDYGPEGLLGSQRATVYRELGLPPPPKADTSSPSPTTVTTEDVRQALRDFDRPSELSLSPLAVVLGGSDPSAAVRALLASAASEAFGGGPDERLMRELVDRAYVNSSVTHEQAADELHVSRTTYFRRLRQATGRVADHVLTTLAARDRPG